MPAYDYACQGCGHTFELRHKMSEAPAASCPACGGAAKRLLSAGAGAIVKGSRTAPAPECGAGMCCGPEMRESCGCAN